MFLLFFPFSLFLACAGPSDGRGWEGGGSAEGARGARLQNRTYSAEMSTFVCTVAQESAFLCAVAQAVDVVQCIILLQARRLCSCPGLLIYSSYAPGPVLASTETRETSAF